MDLSTTKMICTTCNFSSTREMRRRVRKDALETVSKTVSQHASRENGNQWHRVIVGDNLTRKSGYFKQHMECPQETHVENRHEAVSQQN